MSVNTELQALLTKMGGTPLESDSNSDLVKKISNAYEGGGSGGNSGSLIVNFSSRTILTDGTSKNVIATDATAEEIFAALPNVIFRREVAPNYYAMYTLISYGEYDGAFYATILDYGGRVIEGGLYSEIDLQATSANDVMATEAADAPSPPPST